MITLRQPTLAEVQQVRIWRNDPSVLPMLRTGYLTEEQQAGFYRDVVSDPGSDHRYFALTTRKRVDSVVFGDGALAYDHDFGVDVLVGLGGLTYLSRIPGEAEISLILGPDFRGRGFGVGSVRALLDEAGRLELRAVIGECYSGGAIKFWQAMALMAWPAWRLASHGVDTHGTYGWRWERTR